MFNNKLILLNIFVHFIVLFIASHAVLSHFGYHFIQIDNHNFINLFYLLGGFSIILLIIRKYTWLPFLGHTVIPSILLPETKNVGDTSIKIKITPNTKVAYWTTLPSTDNKPSVKNAYGDYSNAGVTKSNNDGFATLTFNKGTGYIVPSGQFIKPHIHYRELNTEYSMIGPVNTVFL